MFCNFNSGSFNGCGNGSFDCSALFQMLGQCFGFGFGC